MLHLENMLPGEYAPRGVRALQGHGLGRVTSPVGPGPIDTSLPPPPIDFAPERVDIRQRPPAPPPLPPTPQAPLPDVATLPLPDTLPVGPTSQPEIPVPPLVEQIPLPPPPPPAAKPFYKEPLFWGVVGVVAVGGATAIVLSRRRTQLGALRPRRRRPR